MKQLTVGGALLMVLGLAIFDSSLALAQYKAGDGVCWGGFRPLPAPIPDCGDNSDICIQRPDCNPGDFSPHCNELKTGRVVAIARACQVDDTTIDRFRLSVFEDSQDLCVAGTRITCGLAYDGSIAYETMRFVGDWRVPTSPGQRSVTIFCLCT
jgi:hypothetical protein